MSILKFLFDAYNLNSTGNECLNIYFAKVENALKHEVAHKVIFDVFEIL